ncbi:MAG: YtxH domain-containing protein [Lactobacillaceae bacterium]|jgi:hypothetical protein|nr:YtxH domain-containing protein [Lactobacillaceae bacterium]
MAKGKGILATLLVGGAAAYVAFKNLSEEKQKELSQKAAHVGNELKELGSLTADSAQEAAGNISEKVQTKYNEVDERLNQSKFSEQYKNVKDGVGDFVTQATEKVNEAKDASGKWFDKAKGDIDDLRNKFSKEEIELVDDDKLAEGLKDLNDDSDSEK